MATRRRNPRSKAEISKNFNDVEEAENNRSPISDAQHNATAARSAQVREAVKGFTVEAALTKVTQLSTDLNKTIGDLTEKISSKAQELQILNEAVELTKQDLEELHGKEAILHTTGELLASHKATVDELTKERERVQREFDDLNEASRRDHNEAVAQRNRAWQQEEAQYVYNRDQLRKKETDAWTQSQQDLKRKNDLFQQDLERGWKTREDELKVKEVEFANFKKQVEEFPALLKKTEEAEFKKGFNTANKEANQEKLLLQKDFEAFKSLAESEKKNLASTIGAQVELINKLQQQLGEAQTQIKSIAEKALESASSERAFSQIANFQNRNGTEANVTRSKS